MQGDLDGYEKYEDMHGDLIYQSRYDRAVEKDVMSGRPKIYSTTYKTPTHDGVIDSHTKFFTKNRDGDGRYTVKFD